MKIDGAIIRKLFKCLYTCIINVLQVLKGKRDCERRWSSISRALEKKKTVWETLAPPNFICLSLCDSVCVSYQLQWAEF